MDLLAPGCAVPSYELTPDGKLKESAVSGTSFAAPIVAFVAATLASRDPFHRQPGRIKSRILVSTDFNYNPRLITYSSGTLNVAKTLGYPFDMVEVTRGEGRKLYYGTVSNKGEIAPIECNGRAIEFKEIRKIARSRSPSDYVLIFSTEDDGNPSVLKRDFCPTSSIGNVTVKFTDFETGDEMSFGASEIQDYVPSVGG